MRWVYIGAGLTALAASGYMAVIAFGGLSSQSAPGLMAMGVVLAVGAASIGHALAGRHLGIAVVIGLGMVAGEAGAMLQTAQRVTAAREATRAPIAAVADKRKAALDDLEAAEAAKAEPADWSRLALAERTKQEAEVAVRDKSAEKGCRENCRLLLQTAADNAAGEVAAARAELADHDARQARALAQRIDAARAVVATLPAPQSATPLADNIGLPEWFLDIFEALALSLAINLPASALIALGVKMGSRSRETTPVSDTAQVATVPTRTERKARNAAAEAERFGLAMLRPAADGRLSPGDLRAAYLRWCADADHHPLPIGEIAPALGMLFKKSGIEVTDGVAVGVAIKPRQIVSRQA